MSGSRVFRARAMVLASVGTPVWEAMPVIITERGQPVMVAISYAQYVSLLETIDILSDREFKEQLIAGIAEDRQGKRVSLSDAIIQLGWE
ncbi:type II toxin-antitoxin system Phd/YefM family antitoxin [Limnofasciculus baicalensis]|uniref:Antitoxin n=1 Tax=Limnofasciculus baicalensis BBK-W-15 TaxID=2699891 RepID=A0AAE3KL23_9CYAN|nr:type II toxin-antitoxin system Phd/YefM family antitoxin [Limnofasciculus baicalensis]MCP2727201.1 type II toxin-antitoxin system Phd/YefM family antitoxin [Limnofasciculus baicalensis BBK-W-15]